MLVILYFYIFILAYLVVEDPVPEFGALLGNFSKFFEARRPLRPERKVVKRRVKDQVKEPKIIVSIRNAQNLPVRTTKYDEEVRFYYGRDKFLGLLTLKF